MERKRLSYKEVVKQYPPVSYHPDGPAEVCRHEMRRTRYEAKKKGTNCLLPARYKLTIVNSYEKQKILHVAATEERWYCWQHLAYEALVPGRPEWKKFIAWGYRRGFLTKEGELNEYQVPLEERRAAGL